MNMLSVNGIPVLAAGAGSFTPLEWWLTGVLSVLVLAGIFSFGYTKRSGIIARATTKEAVRQPVFALVLGIALVILILNTFLPFFSLGEDVKMLKDCGLATILICGLLLGVWTSSTSIADEIEGKTAMTLLSKPINRRQFVVGKYFGILRAVLLLMIPLILVFLFLIFYKVGYDARESAKEIPPWFTWVSVKGLSFQLPLPVDERWGPTIQIIPGLILIFLEIAVLTAVSVAISTRLPMVINMVTCFTIFVIGHLTPVLVKTTFGGFEPVKFVAQLIATVLPALEVFNMQAAVATGTMVPPDYLGFSTVYCAVYSTMAILLAFILFEDRDLA